MDFDGNEVMTNNLENSDIYNDSNNIIYYTNRHYNRTKEIIQAILTSPYLDLAKLTKNHPSNFICPIITDDWYYTNLSNDENNKYDNILQNPIGELSLFLIALLL